MSHNTKFHTKKKNSNFRPIKISAAAEQKIKDRIERTRRQRAIKEASMIPLRKKTDDRPVCGPGYNDVGELIEQLKLLNGKNVKVTASYSVPDVTPRIQRHVFYNPNKKPLVKRKKTVESQYAEAV